MAADDKVGLAIPMDRTDPEAVLIGYLLGRSCPHRGEEDSSIRGEVTAYTYPACAALQKCATSGCGTAKAKLSLRDGNDLPSEVTDVVVLAILPIWERIIRRRRRRVSRRRRVETDVAAASVHPASATDLIRGGRERPAEVDESIGALRRDVVAVAAELRSMRAEAQKEVAAARDRTLGILAELLEAARSDVCRMTETLEGEVRRLGDGSTEAVLACESGGGHATSPSGR